MRRTRPSVRSFIHPSARITTQPARLHGFPFTSPLPFRDHTVPYHAMVKFYTMACRIVPATCHPANRSQSGSTVMNGDRMSSMTGRDHYAAVARTLDKKSEEERRR